MSAPPSPPAEVGLSPIADPEYAVAAAWLENFQAAVYESLGDAPRTAEQETEFYRDSNIIEKTYEAAGFGVPSGPKFESYKAQYLEEMALARRSMPTRFENPQFYAIISRIAADVERSLADSGLHLPVKPLFGTLPTGRVNGLAIAVPATAYRVILLEDGLFGFANLMCKAVAMALPERHPDNPENVSISTDLDDVKRTLGSNPEIDMRFFDALAAYLVGGHPHRAQPYLPSKTVLYVAGALRDAMECFVLAHEYGHLVAGHLDHDGQRKAMVAEVQADAIPTDWRQEFEADLLGLRSMLMVRMRAGYDLALSFWGADAFFGCIEVVEKAVSVLLHGEERPWSADTHPPTADRRIVIRQGLLELTKEADAATSEAALKLASIIETIVDELWQKVRPAFVGMHADGIRPTAGWIAVA